MEGLSLVIPAHNSGKVLESSINNYYSAFSKKLRNFEIIVVCNDCQDNTAEISRTLGKRLPIQAIEIPQRGKGYALVTGFNNAKFDYLGFLDADNPFNLDSISKMISRLNNYDVVIASKYLRKKAKIQDSFLRRMLSLGGSIFSRFFFSMNFRDTQAGCKFFRKDVWQAIDRNFVCNGFDFDVEFLYKISKKKFKILETYIPLKREKFSTFRLKYLPGMVKRLLKLRFVK